MSASIPDADRLSRLNSVETAKPVQAKASLKDFETRPELLLREAIKASGLSIQEVMFAMGIEDQGHFTRLLDGNGKERLWWHQLVAKLPARVWRELMLIMAPRVGFQVRRSITLRERVR